MPPPQLLGARALAAPRVYAYDTLMHIIFKNIHQKADSAADADPRKCIDRNVISVSPIHSCSPLVGANEQTVFLIRCHAALEHIHTDAHTDAGTLTHTHTPLTPTYIHKHTHTHAHHRGSIIIQ